MNIIGQMQQQLSIISIGVHNIMMRLQYIDSDGEVIATELIHGLEMVKTKVSFITICVNIQNLPCTQIEAESYGSKLLTTFTMRDTHWRLINVTKSETIENIFTMDSYLYMYQGDYDATLTEHMNDFRSCPKHTMSTENNRFLYEDNAVYTIKCIPCPINTYYYETSMLPNASNISKTMYIHMTHFG